LLFTGEIKASPIISLTFPPHFITRGGMLL
jgi:hypothetical protein